MELEEKLSNLSFYYDKEELLLLTAAQTQKDLLQFNIEYILNVDHVTFADLMTALKPIIVSLLESNKEKLVQIFYRIDVSEHKIAQSFATNSIEETTKKISELILHRELKKVIIRKHYQEKL